MIFIIGSGPSGIASAYTLLRRGIHVTLLDVGFDLEEERRGITERLRGKNPSEWDKKSLECYKAGMPISGMGVEYKTAYGSLYPYKNVPFYRSVNKNAHAHASYAQGGFSSVWGASLRTYGPDDLKTWPIGVNDLADYYKEIFTYLPIAASFEAMETLGEEITAPMRDLMMSRQIKSLLEDIKPFREDFEKDGCFIETSKLALRAAHGENEGCVYCGLCLYGCPYGHIFNSAFILNEMKKDENFTYCPGIFVESLKENTGNVRITAREISTGEEKEYLAEKVYLGCGVFSTARILLQSYEFYDQPLTCLDSQYFLFPMLSFKRTGGISKQEIHTLNQLCVSIHDSLGQCQSFLQIYGYNDLYESTLRTMTGPCFGAAKGLVLPIMERLLYVLGTLHSNYSASLNVSLKRHEKTGIELRVEGLENRSMPSTLREVYRKFSRICRKAGVLPIFPQLSNFLPGRGYHGGGSFPMRNSPRMFESDLLGRPYSFKRVHIVDASVFPTIPAGPMAINIMANAARIADQSMSNG